MVNDTSCSILGLPDIDRGDRMLVIIIPQEEIDSVVASILYLGNILKSVASEIDAADLAASILENFQ